MKTILVPVDFSSATTPVCGEARKLSKLIKARLVFLSVSRPPSVVMNDYSTVDSVQLAAAIAVDEKVALRKLRALGRRFKSAASSVKTVHANGDPAHEIIAHANRIKADYLVLGSHGHGALYDLFVGTTTQSVLKKADCPVLVVRVKKSGPARK